MTVSNTQKRIYFEGRANGLSIEHAARQAGFSESSGKRFEQKFPDGGTYSRAVKMLGELPDPLRDKDLSPEAKRALKDFGYFQLRYLGRIPVPWQVMAAERVVEYLATPDKEFLVINCPPGVGKSTTFTHDLVCWLIVRNRAIRILLGSATARLAGNYAARVRRTLETVRPLECDDQDKQNGTARDAEASMSEDFGRFKPIDHETWTKDAFIVEQYEGVSITEKEPTVTAVGRDQEFIGGRYDFCIWDDLVTSNRLRSEETIEKDQEWWDTYAERRLEPGGLLILQGQRMRAGDLYQYCLNMEIPSNEDEEDEAELGYEMVTQGAATERVSEGVARKYHHIIFKAHYPELCRGVETHRRGAKPYPDGCLLYPERLSWKELKPLMHNKPEMFAVVYQQEDVAPDKVLVPKLWVDGNGAEFPGCWDHDRDRLEIPKGLIGGDGNFWSVMSCDPSPSKFWALEWFCLASGSRIATRRGEIPIESVSLDDEVLTRAGWQPVQHVTYMGDKPVLEVGLSNGRTLRLTADHKVLTADGWRRADELTLASLVVTPHSRCSDARTTGSLSPSNDQVLARVGMSGRTVGLGHVGLDVRGAEHVGSVVFNREMCRQDTETVAAEMAHLGSFGDFSNQRSISKAMGQRFSKATSSLANLPVRSAADGCLTAVPNQAVTYDFASGEEVRLIDRNTLGLGISSVVTGFADDGFRASDGVAAFTHVHVVSVTAGPVSPVYDIGVVGDLHEFTAEGVIVHNCIHPESGQRFLMDLERRAMEADDFLDWNYNDGAFTGLLHEWWQTSVKLGVPITHVIVEVNAAQKFLLQYDHVKRWMMHTNVEIISHSTHANKSDANYGIETIRPHWRFGRVRLPGKGTGRLCSLKLVDEVTQRVGTDDCLMAHWFVEWQYPLIYMPDAVPESETNSWRPTWMLAKVS